MPGLGTVARIGVMTPSRRVSRAAMNERSQVLGIPRDDDRWGCVRHRGDRADFSGRCNTMVNEVVRVAYRGIDPAFASPSVLRDRVFSSARMAARSPAVCTGRSVPGPLYDLKE
jgi:hypothetical protein